jgi:hypothetical protein
MTRHQLMRTRCRYCGRLLRYANIPNRGPVMAHAAGDGVHCRRMQAMGRDLVTRAEEDKARKTLQAIQRFAYHVGMMMRRSNLKENES